jgi:transposase
MKKDARSLSPKAQEVLRMRAVAAVTSKQMTQVEAAHTFGVTRQAVGVWVRKARTDGEAALVAKPKGRPRTGGRLSKRQAAAVCRAIRDRHPEQLRLPFVLWTAAAVRQWIRRKYNVTCSLRTVQRYLKAWGFTPQKPRRRAWEQDGAAVQRWLHEEYPAICSEAKRRRARIYWGDEMGVRSDHQAGRSYAPKGRTPVVPGTGRRFGCNTISAITNRGDLAFMVFKKRFTTDVFLRFLRRLVQQAGRRLFLIVDSHPVHKSRKVQQWLASHAEAIRVFYLPGYSPELNPDEMLNNDVKANAVGRRRAHDQQQLMRNVRGYLQNRRSQPELVIRYFHEESVRYAAAT